MISGLIGSRRARENRSQRLSLSAKAKVCHRTSQTSRGTQGPDANEARGWALGREKKADVQIGAIYSPSDEGIATHVPQVSGHDARRRGRDTARAGRGALRPA